MFKQKLRQFIFQREALLALFIIIFGAIASFASPYFFQFANFQQVFIAIALDLIVAIGMTIVLVSGGIDLSVGSVIGMCAAILGLAFGVGMSIPLAVTVAIVGGVVIGLMNGWLIAWIKINPIITTLGTMTIARSGCYILTAGYPLSSIPPEFKAFSAGNVLGIPNNAVVAFLGVILFHIALRNHVGLRKFFFLGGNEAAAFRAGIRVAWYKLLAYVISGIVAALAGILLVARLGSAFPHSGLGTELRVISACIIGGCSISGGKGTVIGSFLGVLLLGLISNVLVLLNVSVYWQGVITGSILILAVASDAILNKEK